MRTILVNHLLEPPRRVTGITRFLFAMLRGLLDNTNDHYILATAWAREDLPEALQNSRLIVETHKFYQSNTINIFHQRRLMPGMMQRYHADIEFNSNPVGGFGVQWPRVMTIHDLYLDLLPEEYSHKTVFVGKSLMRLSTYDAAGIMVPSQSTRSDVQRFYPHLKDRTFVVHEAPAQLSSSGNEPSPFSGRYGLLVGNLSPNKNIASLVRSIAILRARGVTIPFIHVGRDEAHLIDKHCASNGIERAIVSAHGLSDGELTSAYRNAAFFINTSLHEGFCLPLIEAQSCGTPVIASNRSALPEVAGDGAILIDPQNAAAIADAMEKVWTDEALAQDLSRRALKNAERFSWDRAARELRAHMERILTHRSGIIAESVLPMGPQPAPAPYDHGTGKNRDYLSH